MITTVTAPDIECDGCANSIKRALAQIEGVDSVTVDVDSKQVTVIHGDSLTSGQVVAALGTAGFPATPA